jgi:hypothetical protein
LMGWRKIVIGSCNNQNQIKSRDNAWRKYQKYIFRNWWTFNLKVLHCNQYF